MVRCNREIPTRDEANRLRVNRIALIDALIVDLQAERDRLQAERTDK